MVVGRGWKLNRIERAKLKQHQDERPIIERNPRDTREKENKKIIKITIVDSCINKPGGKESGRRLYHFFFDKSIWLIPY